MTTVHQTVQRVADSWRSAIGSAGITLLLSFCESEDDLKDSDEARIKFAKKYLDGYRFMYRDTDSENKKVCLVCELIYWSPLLMILRNGRGAFVVA
jgi:hypothetical protein